MDIVNKKINFYYIGMGLLTFKIFNMFSILIQLPSLINAIITSTIAVSFLVHYVQHKDTKKEIIIIGILAIFIAYTYWITKELMIVLTFLAIVSFKDVKLENILKIILTINIALMLIHIIMYIFCYIFSKENIVYFYNANMEMRHTFLLTHPNNVGKIIMWSFAMYTYLENDHIKRNFIIGIVLAIFLYVFPESRTSTLGIVLILILNLVVRLKDTKGYILKVLKIMCKMLFVVLSIVIMFIIVQYNKFPSSIQTAVDNIDKVLSRRIWFSRLGYEKYGDSILPQYIEYKASVYQNGTLKSHQLLLDCTYTKLPINYGYIYTIMISILLYKITPRLSKKELTFVLLFIVLSISESYILEITLAFPILILASHIYDSKETRIRRGEK